MADLFNKSELSKPVPSRFHVHTLGCKANTADSESLGSELLRKGWIADSEDPEVVIVNTCTVTDPAHKDSLSWAKRYRKKYPSAQVVATGCAVEVQPSVFRAKGIQTLARAEVAGFIKTGASGVSEDTQKFLSIHPMDRDWPSVSLRPAEPSYGRARSFLKIQEGCDSFCTFCVIPYGRGPSRSASIADIVQAVQDRVNQGFREVILTATNLGDFRAGEVVGPSVGLVRLLKALLAETSVERIRLTSLDPIEWTDPLIELMATEPRICKHAHVSLQSPHTQILRKMKRGYGSDQAAETFRKLHEIRDVFVGVDLIAGFPGETPEIFQESLDLMRDWPWQRLHVFPYSERSATPATRLPGSIPVSERKSRTRQWIELSNGRYEAFVERVAPVGSVVRGILLETRKERQWRGHTSNNLSVRVDLSDECESAETSSWAINQVVDASVVKIYTDKIAQEVRVLAKPCSS